MGKLHEMDHPPEDDEQKAAKEKESSSAFMGKIKMGFGKLMASAPVRDDVEAKLKEAREELPKHLKVFAESRQQLLEAIDIIDQKLNVEVVYYVQQFANFMKERKTGDITPIEAKEQQNVNVGRRTVSMEEKEAAAVLEAVLPVQEINEAQRKEKEKGEGVCGGAADGCDDEFGYRQFGIT